MIATLVEQYVDDISNDFAVLATAGDLKDFVKSYFVGTIAAGLAYLAMTNDGYIWGDHFENMGGGNSSAAKSPDFVFTGPGTGVALVESKGTRRAKLRSFDGTVDAGYVDQVEPHLGYTVGGATATHGYCIGGWLTSTTKAEILIHHTAVPAIGGRGGLPPSEPVAQIQRQNYATAFALAHSPQLGDELRGSDAERHDVPFARIEWAGGTWLTSAALWPWPWRWLYPLGLSGGLDRYIRDEPQPFFAVEEAVATAVLSRFHGFEPRGDSDLPIEPLSSDLRNAGRRGEGPQSGAVFPDGLAVIRSGFKFAGFTMWRPSLGQFSPL